MGVVENLTLNIAERSTVNLVLKLGQVSEQVNIEATAPLLEQALTAGCRDPNVVYLLALAFKRQGKTREARKALQQIRSPDAGALLQLGVLSLRE